MKKIDFNYDMRKIKKVCNKEGSIKWYIYGYHLIILILLSLFFAKANPIIFILIFIPSFLIYIPNLEKHLKNKCEALDNLFKVVLNDKELKKSDFSKSYDYVKSVSVKKELLNGKTRVKSRKKVIDHCMISEKEKIVVLRQIIKEVESKKDYNVNIETYLLGRNDILNENLVMSDDKINGYALNKENIIVKKLIKSKK